MVYTRHHKQKQINIRIIKLRCISAPKNWSHIKNTVVLTILTFWHIQCLHLIYAEIAWVLVSSGIQVQLQVILNPDYLPDYLSVSYDCVESLWSILISGEKIGFDFGCGLCWSCFCLQSVLKEQFLKILLTFSQYSTMT